MNTEQAPDTDFKKDDPTQHVMVALRQQDVLKDYQHKENFIRFFEEKGQDVIRPITMFPFKGEGVKKDFLKEMSINQCHQNALSVYVRLRDSFQVKLYYGFADGYERGYNDDYYDETVQHSFLTIELPSKDDPKTFIFDPTLSLINLTRKSERLHVFKNYFGVKVTDEFVNEHLISADKTKIRSGFSFYLKMEVFSEKEKTDEILQLL